MKSRSVLVVALVGLAVTATTAWFFTGRTSTDDASIDDPVSTVLGTVAPTTAVVPGSVVASDDGPQIVSAYPAGVAGVEFEVAGPPLPSAMGQIYLDSGGSLLTEPQAARYGIGGFPSLRGSTVYTTDVEVTITVADELVEREDAMVWLFTEDRPLARLTADLAVAIGLPGATSSETRDGSSGPCSMSTFELPGAVWTIGGCEFDDWPGVRSLAVSRLATFDATASSAVTELTAQPDVSAQLAALPGSTVVSWSTSFGQPDPSTGAVVKRTVTIDVDADPSSVADRLQVTLAAGAWRRATSGDGDEVSFSAPFAVWSITADAVTYMVWSDQ